MELSMTTGKAITRALPAGCRPRRPVDHACAAAEAVRALNHVTLSLDAADGGRAVPGRLTHPEGGP
jgi:hypothetical protein